MTCRGIRPDGNQCTCPDEYTSSETGLCASCGAPGSTALVPVGSTEMMADPEVAALYDGLQPKAQQFIRAYVETLSIDAGAEAAGVHRNSHYYWLKNTPGYREVFDVAIRQVKDRWNRHLTEKTMNGLKEVMYDSEGNVKHTRIREDAALLKMKMMAVDPDTYNPEKSTGSNVTIVVKQVKEGGWGSEEDQVTREEVGRIEVASVDENGTDE